MKNDKLLRELRKIEADLLTARGEPAAYISVQNLIIEVEEEIREEANKASGQGSVAKAAQNILKTAVKVNNYRECLHKAYRTSRSLNICDGFRAVRFNLDTAPVLSEHPASYKDYPDIDRLIGSTVNNSVTINVPSRASLVAYIKTEKARLKAKKDRSEVRLIMTDGYGRDVHVNAEFLLDMLDALPGATVTIDPRRLKTSTLYFKAENGDGVLLQLRRPKEGE